MTTEEKIASCREYFRGRDENIPLRILIVDDSDLHRKLAMKLITTAFKSYPVKPLLLQADDGLTAIEAFKAFPSGVDIILMDFIMDHLNGPDAAKILRFNYGFEGLLLGVTGNALVTDIDKFLKSGADEVILKPFKIKKFMEILQHLGVVH